MDERLRQQYPDPEAAQAVIEELARVVPYCDPSDPRDEEKVVRLIKELIALQK
jgi:hypothetical protein